MASKTILILVRSECIDLRLRMAGNVLGSALVGFSKCGDNSVRTAQKEATSTTIRIDVAPAA